MTDFFVLAADYIEKMSNPAYGVVQNDDYALRFGKLLDSEGFLLRLRREVERLDDPDVLTSHGWLWLLGWTRANGLRLDQALMRRLFHRWTSPFLKVAVLDVATRRDDSRRQRSHRVPLDAFPHPLLRHLLLDSVVSPSEELQQPEASEFTEPAVLLVALLQTGTPLSIDAASSLLRYEWTGQRALLESFWQLCDTLDDDTRSVWLDRLVPPPRPRRRNIE
jgi:hypothetical protein